MRLRPIIIAFALACFFLIVTVAFAGNDGPHAGDYISSEFVRHGEDVLQFLNTPDNANLLSEDQRRALAIAVRETPVHSVHVADEVLRDPDSGDPVDALTVGDPTSPTGKSIRLQREGWQGLFAGQADVYHLVLHEYLWVLGLDDKNYRISLHLDTSHASKTDALSGKTWHTSAASLGVDIHVYFLFDGHQSYRLIETLTDFSDFGTRAMESYGTYALGPDRTVTLQTRGKSCPLSADELNVNPSTLSFKDGILRIDINGGGHSFFLQPFPSNSPAIDGLVQWGCFSAPSTFSPFGNGILGKPVLAIPNTAVPTANANDRYQAIAYSYRTKRIGQSWNQWTPRDAIRMAGESCGQPDCVLMGWSSQCVAVAVSDLAKNSWTAWDADRAKAEDAAWQGCINHYGDGAGCRLLATTCLQP